MRRFNPDKELKKIQHGNKKKIILFIISLLVMGVIGYSFALYQVRYSKRIIYTKVAPFSNHDLDLAVYVGDTKLNDFPENAGYKYIYDHITCEKEGITTAKWDIEQGGLSVLTKGPNKCDIYFVENLEIEFPYIGEQVTEFVVPYTGNYKLEVWGAQGTNGGLGGYSHGEVSLNKNDKIYIAVGGSGPSGGYNGGAPNGGGATHIATADGELSSLVDNKESVLIVAGGGGSGWGSGNGGGISGGDGTRTSLDSWNENLGRPITTYVTCYGGTQTTAGSCYITDTGGGNLPNVNLGSFGAGSCGTNCGGGGYYGGAAYGSNNGGGGSGYISTNLNNAETIAGQQSGDGKAKITYLGNS